MTTPGQQRKFDLPDTGHLGITSLILFQEGTEGPKSRTIKWRLLPAKVERHPERGDNIVESCKNFDANPAMNRVPAVFRRIAVALLLLLTGVVHAQSAPSIQVIPSAPRYLEPVYLRTNTGASAALIYGARVSMMTGSLVVDYDWIIFLGPPPPNGWMFDASLGSFPAGTYTVNANTPVGRLTTQFTVASRSPMQADLFVPPSTSPACGGTHRSRDGE